MRSINKGLYSEALFILKEEPVTKVLNIAEKHKLPSLKWLLF